MTSRSIIINPVTRVEGHGKIEIFLNDIGDVDKAYFQVPELRGFEKFCEGRAAEEMPILTSRICGVCPTAHHIASSKALDALYRVDPTSAAKKIRELMYTAFLMEDHALHFFFLGGPDFIVGTQAPASQRNILGVIAKVGKETAGKVIRLRKECRKIMETIGGTAIHPVFGLPGGVSKPLTEDDRKKIKEVAKYGVEFYRFALKIFDDVVLKNKEYVDLIAGDIYKIKTYYMGMVDEENKVSFYDGQIRVVDPDGKEYAKFKPEDYLHHIAEHVEPWTYMKFTYLKNIGWKGFIDGKDSGIYRVAPLARLNVSEGMTTTLAQIEYERMYDTLGAKPLHNTLAFHWARLIEGLYAAERMTELADDPELTDPNIRNLPKEAPSEGIGAIEAPRGTLIHHYKADEKGLIRDVNLIVSTQNNAAAICMSIEKAASNFIKGGNVSEGLLNMVEIAFRAYDPCLGCATHSFPGDMPMLMKIYDKNRNLIQEIGRDY